MVRFKFNVLSSEKLTFWGLNSTMVRFKYRFRHQSYVSKKSQFHYGSIQINTKDSEALSLIITVSIPLWFDSNWVRKKQTQSQS